MSHSQFQLVYTAKAFGPNVTDLVNATKAVPLDYDLPRMLGLLPTADTTTSSGLQVTRTINLAFGDYGTITAASITLETGETASPIKAVAIPGGLGTDYAAPPLPTFADSHGNGASGFFRMGVGNISILSGGTGYTAPVATLVGGQLDPNGTPAQVSVQLTGGVVTGLTVTDPGNGYQVFPAIQIADPNGSGAVCVASLKPVAFSLQRPGSGYKSPSIAITPFFPYNTPDASNQVGIVKGYMLQALNQQTRSNWAEAVTVS